MIHKILLTVTLALSLAFTSYAQNTKEQTKENKKEACSDKFDIEDDNIVINNDKSFLSGYFAIRFDAKSDVPTTMKAIMKIIDCKGNVSYISIPLVLDTKSNLWVGKFGIPQVAGCPFSVEALSLIVTNECGDEFGETSYKEKGNVGGDLKAKFKKLKGSKSKGYDAF